MTGYWKSLSGNLGAPGLWRGVPKDGLSLHRQEAAACSNQGGEGTISTAGQIGPGRVGDGWICLGTLEATRVLGQERLTLGPHSGKERVKITSASVTTPFLKRRSSSSSDEHLSLVKEKLQLVGICLTPGHLCSQSGVQGLMLLQSRSSGAGTQVKEGGMETPRVPDGYHP